MKQRHEEIRQKYGEPSDYFKLNWEDDQNIGAFFGGRLLLLYAISHLLCVSH